MKIAIVGAGAIGCFLAARLSARGHEITLVGRGEQVAAIQRDSLLVREADNTERRYALRAVEALDEPPELALLTVKTQDVPRASRDLLPWVAGVPVVALQNGVRADGLAADVLGRESLLGAVVMCATSYLQPGRITVQFAGWLVMGEPFGPPTQRTRALARTLSDAVPTYVTADLRRARWTKLIFNLNNGLCAATGLMLPELARDQMGRALSVRVMKEGIQVARAAGIRLERLPHILSPRALRQNPTIALVALLQGTLNTALATLPERAAQRVLAVAGRGRLNQIALRGSTWQSLARGKASEIDYLNGEIVALGKELHLATPYNAHLVEVVHAVERDHVFRALSDLRPPGLAPAATISVGRRVP
ncbi:MAG: 2-dehydropantoate 2-reductase [Ktedonobacterales bacterium]|nr:2-dehydropantoate 2-reductase [Ktedonobacterales bacterium]